MSTQPLATHPNPSVLSKAELETAAQLYLDAPVETLDRLKTLWQAEKGLTGNIANELTLMVNALSMHFDTHGGSVDVHVNLWNACVAGEIIWLASEMIRERSFADQPLIWLKPVLTLNCTLTSLWEMFMDPNRLSEYAGAGWHSISDSIAASYFGSIGSVWNVLWTKRSLLLREEKPGVAGLVTMFAYHVANIHRYYYPNLRHETTRSSSSILGVALACWMHNALDTQMSSDHRPRLRAFETVLLYAHCVEQLVIVESSQESYNTLWRSRIDPFLECIGPLAFMRTCCSELSSRDDVVGRTLLGVVGVLLSAVEFSDLDDMEGGVPASSALASPSRRAYWDLPMTAAIAEAFERDYHTYAIGYTMDSPAHICTCACKLLLFAMQSLAHCHESPPVMDGLSMYRILSCCLRFLCRALQTHAKLDFDEFSLTVESFAKACLDSTNVGRKAQGKLQIIAARRVREGLHAAVKKSWYIDLCPLLSLQDKCDGENSYAAVLLSWIRFGEAFGLAQMSEHDRHVTQDKRLCSWGACKYHIQPSPSSLSTCKGCGERNYCSRECQKKDWKQGGHREKCRRLPQPA